MDQAGNCGAGGDENGEDFWVDLGQSGRDPESKEF